MAKKVADSAFPIPVIMYGPFVRTPLVRTVAGNRKFHPMRANPHFSSAHRNPKRKRGLTHELSSLTLRVTTIHRVAKSLG